MSSVPKKKSRKTQRPSHPLHNTRCESALISVVGYLLCSPRHIPCNMALTLLPWDVGKHVRNEMLPYIHRSWASTALMLKAGLMSFSIWTHFATKSLEHAQPWTGMLVDFAIKTGYADRQSKELRKMHLGYVVRFVVDVTFKVLSCVPNRSWRTYRTFHKSWNHSS